MIVTRYFNLIKIYSCALRGALELCLNTGSALFEILPLTRIAFHPSYHLITILLQVTIDCFCNQFLCNIDTDDITSVIIVSNMLYIDSLNVSLSVSIINLDIRSYNENYKLILGMLCW